MKIIYTCLFSAYEELKEPTIISKGWKYICYTDQPVKSNIWEIVQIKLIEPPQIAARWYKIMHWIDWQYSMWVDAAFQINIDLNAWWETNFKSPLSSPAHPHRDCVYDEILACKHAQRAGEDILEATRIEYEAAKVPAHNGIISSGLLMRENTPECIKLCEDWWQELIGHSNRDQIAFARVSLNFKYHAFQYDYTRQQSFIYSRHFKYR